VVGTRADDPNEAERHPLSPGPTFSLATRTRTSVDPELVPHSEPG
jgi:hypothetical protein